MSYVTVFLLSPIFFNPLSANPTKWSNICLSVFDHFVKLALKGLKEETSAGLGIVSDLFLILNE